MDLNKISHIVENSDYVYIEPDMYQNNRHPHQVVSAFSSIHTKTQTDG